MYSREIVLNIVYSFGTQYQKRVHIVSSIQAQTVAPMNAVKYYNIVQQQNNLEILKQQRINESPRKC